MNIDLFKKVLVLAPHTDDGELGAGGLIARLLENGAEVHYAAFSTANESVPVGFPKNVLELEVKNATKALGIPRECLHIYKYPVRKLNYHRQEILEDLILLRNSFQFDLILLPSQHDVHQDHSTIHEEGVRAFKNKSIFGYELIWNNLSFNAQCCVKLTQKHINKKVAALKKYKSQAGRVYMSEKFVTSLAVTRGTQFGCEYAESFEVVRLVIG